MEYFKKQGVLSHWKFLKNFIIKIMRVYFRLLGKYNYYKEVGKTLPVYSMVIHFSTLASGLFQHVFN